MVSRMVVWVDILVHADGDDFDIDKIILVILYFKFNNQDRPIVLYLKFLDDHIVVSCLN